MRDDHLVAHALELEDEALVLGVLAARRAVRKLEEKLVAPRKAELACPLKTDLAQGVVVDLEAHANVEVRVPGLRLCGEIVVSAPHRLEIEPRLAAMWGADHAAHASLYRRVEHGERFAHVAGAVIDSRQNMAVHIAHGQKRLLGPVSTRAVLVARVLLALGLRVDDDVGDVLAAVAEAVFLCRRLLGGALLVMCALLALRGVAGG